MDQLPRMSIRPGSAAAWMVAIRPRSLMVAVSPVLVGAAMAHAHGGSVPVGLLGAAFAAAVLMQVITNLQNDVGFTMRGGEAIGRRVGQPRATAEGWLGTRSVRRAVFGLSLLAGGLGLLLAIWHGWLVLLVGGLSLLAALAYMGGPRPIAYSPFGELTVFVFFGLVAVLGTEALLTEKMLAITWLPATAIGALASAALAANNHRDAQHDRLIGRRTFVVVFGDRLSQKLFGFLLMVPFVNMVALAGIDAKPAFLLPLVLLPGTFRLWRDFSGQARDAGFSRIVLRTFALELRFALLLSAAALTSAG